MFNRKLKDRLLALEEHLGLRYSPREKCDGDYFSGATHLPENYGVLSEVKKDIKQLEKELDDQDERIDEVEEKMEWGALEEK